MDLLQLMKDDRQRFLTRVKALAGKDGQKTFKVEATELLNGLTHCLQTEMDFIYPELGSYLEEGAEVLEQTDKQATDLLKQSAKLLKMLADKADNVEKLRVQWLQFNKSLELQALFCEEALMPRLRKLMPTIDREDLAEVVLDARGEGLEKSREVMKVSRNRR